MRNNKLIRGSAGSTFLVVLFSVLIAVALALPFVPDAVKKIEKPVEEKPAEEPEEVVQYYWVKEKFPANDADGITHFYVYLVNIDTKKLFEADVKRHLYVKFDTGENHVYASNKLPMLEIMDKLKEVPEIVERTEIKIKKEESNGF